MNNVSGVIITDAPHYRLYKDTEQFVRKDVLPLDVTCQKCEAKFMIDMPSDIRYLSALHQSSRERMDKEWAQYVLYPSLYAKPREREEDRAPKLEVTCPVCGLSLNVTTVIRGRVHDVAPIMEFYKNPPWGKGQGRLRPIPLPGPNVSAVLMVSGLFMLGMSIVAFLGGIEALGTMISAAILLTGLFLSLTALIGMNRSHEEEHHGR